ncbi:hypothetical protein HDU80_005742 [Chytriomyces hyalinus]|nr:hypothetical protein HDU80_005742 [Chytriomyces hyalinus]
MPPEILDRIASFVDANSILNLCHSLLYFKYISKAMLDIADTLRLENKRFDNLAGALPDTLRVVIGDVTTGPGLSERIISESKKKLLQFDFQFEHPFDTGGAFNLESIVCMLTVLSPSELKLYGAAPQEIWNALPHIKGLSIRHIILLDLCKAQILGQCFDLEEVVITMLQFSIDLEYVLPRFLAYTRETRVSKVSYRIFRKDDDGLEPPVGPMDSWIQYVFVVHGWYDVSKREGHRTFQRGVNE